MTTARVAVPAAAILLAATAAGAVARQAPRHVQLRLAEFQISPTAATAAHGRLTLRVVNRGTETHEVLVVKAGGGLPTRNGRVDEEALKRAGRFVGEIPDVKRGAAASHTFNLKSGTYVLLCNLPGHYRSGMHATLTVR